MIDFPTLHENIHCALDWQELEHQTIQRGADIELFRYALKQTDSAIAQAFRNGLDVAHLVEGRSKVIDFILKTLWKSFGFATLNTTALIAVGGYGRGELHPHSDIDLLFLLEEDTENEITQQLSQFLTFLWDIGLPVGHSVRTVDECVRKAKEDITVVTNLMESRLLWGPSNLYENLIVHTDSSHIWPSVDFFSAKLNEQRKRHHKFGDTPYKLEPNVKEGPGGLRDIQMIAWVAQRQWHTRSLHDLVKHHFLTDGEYQELRHGQLHLWRVRFALHLLANRAEDRLLFDYQRQLASWFGYSNKNNNLAVEQFMQTYYRAIMELERLNNMLLHLFQEIILYADVTPQYDIIHPRFRSRFQARKGFLEVVDKQLFAHYPSALLEIILVLQMHSQLMGISASTIRLIREHCHLIDSDFRKNPTNRRLFMEILRQPNGVTQAFRRMNRYGVLAAYWPSFAKVVGRMQYDLFHTYTVDEHTLFVLRNVRRFALNKHSSELPFCSRLIKEIPNPELLYLAALFHDIAKGRGGDHSDLGADEAEIFCLEHGLSHFHACMVAWLVRNHLLMSLTSQRMDISDPNVVYEFARKVGSLQRLKYLYLLTVADIRGTNPNLWNAWRDALLVELYHSALRVLRRGLDIPIISDEVYAENRKTALQILEVGQVSRQDSERIWAQFDEDYFLRHSADEIAWHTQAMLEAGPTAVPLVLVRQFTARGSTEIFIYTRDHKHLFAHIATVLAQLGLDILDARIITTPSGYTLDTFLVLDESGAPIADDYRIDEITHALLEMLRDPQRPPIDVARRVARHVKYFDIRTQVNFETEPESRMTLLELITADHPGLLSKVGQAFIECRVLLENARITTIGAQAEDLFFITDIDHKPIMDLDKQQQIRTSIIRHLGELAGEKQA